VRVVDLHDAVALPRPVGGRPGIAVDDGHPVPVPGERQGGEQAGRPGADNGYFPYAS
jgi:hypothetical protein